MALAEQLDFLPLGKDPEKDSSCIPAFGQLLQRLAAAKPGGRLAEAGSGCGVGTAWLASGLRDGASLVSVESDVTRATAVAELFADRNDVAVHHGDSAAILPTLAPFDLLFFDGLGSIDDLLPERASPVIELVRIGGLLVFDDIPTGTDAFDNQPDIIWAQRKLALGFRDPRLSGEIVPLTDAWSALVATRTV
jgi:predicted O-methyltransferase YrrM